MLTVEARPAGLVLLASRQRVGVSVAIMKWCVAVTTFVVACYSVLEFSLAQPQLHNAGGIPLPSAAPSPQQTQPGVTLASAPVRSQHNHQQGHGLPLPVAPQEPQHHLRNHGVSVASASAQSPSLSGGVPLPPPRPGHTFSPGLSLPKHPVDVVPLEQGHGVPLPPPDIFKGQGSPRFSVGVPLPPHRGVGAAGISVPGSPTLIEGVAALKPVKNVNRDNDVQHAIRLASVHDYLQLSTKADHAVKVTNVISAHKQVCYFIV